MRCFRPLQIDQDDGSFIHAPCGSCGACQTNRRLEWFGRLKEQEKESGGAFFATLTYSNENLTFGKFTAPNGTKVPVMTLDKSDLTLFHKRLRKNSGQKYKYFQIGEYGEKYGRPHYHIIFFGVNPYDRKFDLLKDWGLGNVKVDPVNDARLIYCTQYVLTSRAPQFYKQKEYQRPFMTCSKGLGESYVERMFQWHQNDPDNRNFMPMTGNKFRMPRYLRNRIFTDDQKDAQKAIAEDKIMRAHFKKFPMTKVLTLEQVERHESLKKQRAKQYEFQILKNRKNNDL